MLRTTSKFLLSALAVVFSGVVGISGEVMPELIGAPLHHVIGEGETLLDIARGSDVGYVEMRAANPNVDPWLPAVGTKLLLPTQHILPHAPHRGIVINLAELRLYFFPPSGGAPQSFPIGIGGEGKETPTGGTRISRKAVHPTWFPTPSERSEDGSLAANVPPGENNPMGDYALYLAWRGYAIHGSNRPYSIGRRDSHGCIRLYPEDIEILYRQVKVGTPVTIVDQALKLAWSDGALYLEVHPGHADVDRIESGEPSLPLPLPQDLQQMDETILEFALAAADRLDWPLIYATERRRSGVPVRITR